MEPRAKVESASCKHSVYTHFPKDPNCDICLKTKNKGSLPKTYWYSRAQSGTFWWLDYCGSQSSQWRLWISKQSSICNRGAGLGHPMDPVASVQNKNFTRNPEKLAKVPGTREETKSHLHWQFLGIWQSLWRSFLESLYVDNHTDQKQMGLPKEQCAEWMKGHLRCLQFGLGNEWWVDSIESYRYLRNMQDLLSDGKTPHERRIGMPFDGPVIPLGAMVEYHPISAKDQSRLHQFGAKVLPGIYFSVMHCTRRESGKQTLRLNAKEVVTPQRSGNFIFLVADGTIKIFGREQRLRTSTLTRERPERGEEQEIRHGKLRTALCQRRGALHHWGDLDRSQTTAQSTQNTSNKDCGNCALNRGCV